MKIAQFVPLKTIALHFIGLNFLFEGTKEEVIVVQPEYWQNFSCIN